MAENPYMLTPEEQLLYAAQDPAHPFIDSRVVSTPIEFALNPQKYGYRNLAEAGVDVLSRAGEQAAPYILYNMSPGGVPVTASRNIAADWQNPYMSGTDKSLNTLTNLLNVAMMAAPSQMGQAGASALSAVGQKAGAYADELAPIMKNVARSEVGALQFKPVKLTEDVASEPGYAYHATNAERLDEIARTGKLKTHKPWEYTDQDAWPDGATTKRSYFSENAGTTWHFAPEEGQPVLIRTPKTGLYRERSTGDLYSGKPIPAKKLEYLDESGVWRKLEWVDDTGNAT